MSTLTSTLYGPIKLYPTRVRLWLELDDLTLEVINAQFVFRINDIPYGILSLAIGNDAVKMQSSAVHENIARLSTYARIKVWCQIDRPTEITSGTPNGTFVIFDGYINGKPGIEKSAGTVSYVIHVMHWLGFADRTSCFSPTAAPDTPANLFVNLGFSLDAAANNPNSPASSVTSFGATITQFPTDVWGTIAKILRDQANQVNFSSIAGVTQANTAVLEVLDRFDQDIDRATLALSASLVPFASNMQNALAGAVFSLLNGSTAWNKILTAANLFGFAVIPTVTSATAAPHVTANNRVFKHIPLSEVVAVQALAYQNRPIGGVTLLKVGESSEHNSSNAISLQFTPIGRFASQVPDGLLPGVIKFVQAPPWLSLSGLASQYAGSSVTGEIHTSQNDEKYEQASTADHPLTEAINALSTAGDTIARWLFTEEQYRMRQGSIATRLRFDIAPGSSIRLDLSEAPLLSELNQIQANVYAVELGIDSRSASASTVLRLNGLRTDADGENPGIDVHPMYDSAVWFGTELVRDSGE